MISSPPLVSAILDCVPKCKVFSPLLCLENLGVLFFIAQVLFCPYSRKIPMLVHPAHTQDEDDRRFHSRNKERSSRRRRKESFSLPTFCAFLFRRPFAIRRIQRTTTCGMREESCPFLAAYFWAASSAHAPREERQRSSAPCSTAQRRPPSLPTFGFET